MKIAYAPALPPNSNLCLLLERFLFCVVENLPSTSTTRISSPPPLKLPSQTRKTAFCTEKQEVSENHHASSQSQAFAGSHCHAGGRFIFFSFHGYGECQSSTTTVLSQNLHLAKCPLEGSFFNGSSQFGATTLGCAI